MNVFENRVLQWAIERNLTPAQARATSNEQVAIAAGAAIGDDGFYPQSLRRFVATRLQDRAQEAARERLRTTVEQRVQQEYPQAKATWVKTLEHGRGLLIHSVPIDDITGDE